MIIAQPCCKVFRGCIVVFVAMNLTAGAIRVLVTALTMSLTIGHHIWGDVAAQIGKYTCHS
jgi:hypothetical protein